MPSYFHFSTGFRLFIDAVALTLTLYTWLTWRCFQAKDTQRIPLFGPLGLAAQLGVQNYVRERKFRERVRGWLELVRICWPECPAVVAKNGSFVLVEPAASTLQHLGN
jgi:hypothetical protein